MADLSKANDLLKKRAENLGPYTHPEKKFISRPWKGYGGEPADPSQPKVDRMPNADKLSHTERFLYGILPGFSKSWGGQALSWLGESWAGKALSKLDFAAEGLERGLGFVAQWNDAVQNNNLDDFKNHIADAWYAGGLSADMTNLPIIQTDPDGKQRFHVPTDLPGLSGLTQARERISMMSAQGMDRGEALKQVREEYYHGLGALALRAQLYDTYSHVLLDPVNWVLPYIKPVERIQAAGKFASAFKYSEAFVEGTRATLKASQEALKVAEAAQDTVKIAESTARIADATKILSETKSFLTRWDKLALALTGGGTLKTEAGLTAFEQLARKKSILNPLSYFSLTPEARAHELMTVAHDNIMTRIVSTLSDPQSIAVQIHKAAQGALGNEFGHGFLTIEGRAVQGTLGAIDIVTQDLLKSYDLTLNKRTILFGLQQALGDVNPQTTLASILKGDLATLSKRTGMTTEILEDIGKSLKGIPLTPEEFKLALGNRIADEAAKIGVTMFGVKARGWAEKAALTLKSAETLAFLKMNPAYAVKNFANNEMTILARGLVGRVGLDDTAKLWDRVGFTPFRLNQGFGMAGTEVGGKVENVGGAIAEALKGDTNFLDNIREGINKIKPPINVSDWAQKAETSASHRAMTVGYLQAWREYFWKPGKGFDFVADYVPDAIRANMDPKFIEKFQDVVRSAMSPQEIDEFLKGNLNINVKSILADANQRAGFDIEQVLGHEYMLKIEDGLLDASKRNAVPEYFARLRAELNVHLDELNANSIQRMAEYAEMRITAEGPQGFAKLFASQMDEFWGTHINHATRMESVGTKLRSIVDPKLRSQAWDTVLKENEQYWTRSWDRFDGLIQGMKKGAKKANIEIPESVLDDFKTWKGGWRDFFSRRNKLLREIHDGKGGRTWEDVSAEIDQLYRNMIVKEGETTRSMDNAIGALLPEQVRPGYAAWRNAVAELRMADKEGVVAFRQSIAGLPAKQMDEAFAAHWRERMGRWQELWAEEKMGAQMMAGDPEAAARYNNMAQAAKAEAEVISEAIPEVAKAKEISRVSLENLSTKPRSEFDPAISKALEEEAGDMLSQVEVGEAGRRIPVEGETIGIGSSYPDWYGEIAKKIGGREAVIKALKKIIADKGLDKGKAVEYLKDVGLKHLSDSNTGNPSILITTGDELAAYRMLVHEIENDVDLVARYGYNEAAQYYKFVNDFDEESAFAKAGIAYETRKAEEQAAISAIGETFKLPPQAAPDVAKAAEVAPEVAKPARQFIPDFDKFYKPDPDTLVAQDQFWMTRGFQALDELKAGTLDAIAKPVTKLDDLAPDAKDWMLRYVEHVKGQMSDARYASLRMAEFRRDSALLNYNRRTNFNTYLGMMMPFEFWTTQSIAKWALHSIDRPAMLMTYMRLKKFLNTAGMEDQALPKRLQGSIKIRTPFLPDFMGDGVFFDPLRFTLPFDGFTYPFEKEQQRQMSVEGQAERILQSQGQNGTASPDMVQQAVQTHQGSLWEQAVTMATEQDKENQFDAFDFASLMTAPHAPLVWAYEAMQGTPENIQPFTPMQRMFKGVAGLMGIDWNNSPLNIEGKMRKALGLPAFDKWDDYRVERMLSNMAADGTRDMDEIAEAMNTHQGPLWDEAVKKANFEYGVGAIVSTTLGIPTKSYPAGEVRQRSLKDDFGRAYDAYAAGNPTALKDFFDRYPEYESRLALFKKPEERLQQFLVDQIWNKYNEMPDLNRKEVREQLGADFQRRFLDKGTRSYESIPLDTLQVWMKLLSGEYPGTLGEGKPLDLAPPEIAWRAQVFNDSRDEQFPSWYDMQSDYFKLKEGKARYKFLDKYPQLTDYWDWRRDWFHRNPDVVPYLNDEYKFEYKNEAELQAAEENQPNYTWAEWQGVLTPPLSRLAQDHIERGAPLSQVARERLQEIADQQGISEEMLLDLIEQSMNQP